MTFKVEHIELAINKTIRRLGYKELSTEQHEAIVKFVSGRDVFISLPTGAGKSLCYVLLPMIVDYLCHRYRLVWEKYSDYCISFEKFNGGPSI